MAPFSIDGASSKSGAVHPATEGGRGVHGGRSWQIADLKRVGRAICIWIGLHRIGLGHDVSGRCDLVGAGLKCRGIVAPSAVPELHAHVGELKGLQLP